MAERHKREAKLNRGRKAKNKGREVLPNTKKSTSTEVINQEHKEIIKWNFFCLSPILPVTSFLSLMDVVVGL